MTMGDRLAILNSGVLQQTGEPKNVYANPMNEFVGSFVGSPSMNMLNVTVEHRGKRITLTDENGFEYTVDDELGERVRMADLETARLGIRPENTTVVDSGGIETTVEVIEPVGSDNYLHLTVGQDFIARVDSGVEPETGDTIRVTFDQADLHVFDPQNGASILFEDREKPLVKTA